MAIQPNSSYNRRKHIIQQTAFGCFRLLSYGVAALLFFILGCELFIRYQFVFRGKGGTRA